MYQNPIPQILLTNGISPPRNGRKTFLVCGVQRGGTSMVAAVMRSLGIDMGPGGINHEDPIMLEWSEGDVRDYVARRNSEALIWGFKLPHAALDLQRFTGLLVSPVIVMVFRNIVSTLDSFLVRGDLGFESGIQRLNAYYGAMMTYAATAELPVILVSYERATAAPRKFVEGFISAARLGERTPSQIDLALKSITGDGGGYTPFPDKWYHIGLEYSRTLSEQHCIAPFSRYNFYDLTLVTEIDVSNHLQTDIEIQLSSQADGYPIWINVVIDYGQGLDMLNTHNLLIPEPHTIVRFRHEGAVSRLALGAKHESAERIVVVRYAGYANGAA